MRNIKMIITDLDNTLLRRDKTISDYTIGVFARLKQRGILLAFATARPRRTAIGFLERIPADALILHNGAVVYIGDKQFLSFGIESEIKDRILREYFRDFPTARLSVEIDDKLYANFNVSAIWNNVDAVFTDFTDLPAKPADKIIIGATTAKEIELYRTYLTDNLYIQMSDGKLGLIMNRAATKWNAIQAVAERFGIPTEQIAAFGDDFNDVEMLRNSGIGVAMSNALDECKAVADYICGDCDDDGVAWWLEEMCYVEMILAQDQ